MQCHPALTEGSQRASRGFFKWLKKDRSSQSSGFHSKPGVKDLRGGKSLTDLLRKFVPSKIEGWEGPLSYDSEFRRMARCLPIDMSRYVEIVWRQG